MGSAERAKSSQEERGRREDDEGNVVVAGGPTLAMGLPHTPAGVGVHIVSPVGPLHLTWA